MGLANSQLSELYSLRVTFSCPKCDGHVEEYIGDTFFDWGTEKMSEGIATEETSISCVHCNEEFTLEVIAKPGEKEVKLTSHPGIVVDFRDNTFDHDVEYDDFLAQYEPSDPLEVYDRSMQELRDLDFGSDIYVSAKSAFLKMHYLQYVVILEAYLSDRLISIITDDDEKLLALIGATPALRDKTLKLVEIARDPDFVKKTAKSYLQYFSFHDLVSVSQFYKATLRFNLFQSEANKKELMEVIEMRHHLVHRNGRDADGKVVAIDVAAVQRVRHLVSQVVTGVEKAHNLYLKQRDLDDDLLPF